MNPQLTCILLIDDSESDNFFHEIIIENSKCAKKVMCFEKAMDALHYLKNPQEVHYIQPDVIFLDINMPGMNGWEFLKAYEELDEELKSRVVIIMLTTSLSVDDRERAKQFDAINEYRNKPLTEDYIGEILKKYFKK